MATKQERWLMTRAQYWNEEHQTSPEYIFGHLLIHLPTPSKQKQLKEDGIYLISINILLTIYQSILVYVNIEWPPTI